MGGNLGRWIRRSAPGAGVPADILRWIWRRASSQFSTVVADWCIVAAAQNEIDVVADAQTEIDVMAAAQSVWSAPVAKVVSCG